MIFYLPNYGANMMIFGLVKEGRYDYHFNTITLEEEGGGVGVGGGRLTK